MASADDRFIVRIPGMKIYRIKDGRVEVFTEIGGVEYANMALKHVEALEELYAKTAKAMQELGASAAGNK